MRYTIRHTTQFRYTAPVAESVTEVRMQPRTTEYQQCTAFRLQVRPVANVISYQDHLDNHVHHFTQPALHKELVIIAESEVLVTPRPPLPPALTPADWARVDELVATGEHWDMLIPSQQTGSTAQLAALAREFGVERRSDPLSVVLGLNMAIHRAFAYDAKSTRVDSPIDEALTYRRGVCQDFTHIMLALVRNYLHIPCRYVSGYLHARRDDSSAAAATHAWAEILLPDLGWVGFDPTNNILAGERHIQVAIGRDYHDVPPTRGVYKGNSGSELSVTVRVRPVQEADLEMGEGETAETPAYRATVQELQTKYVQTLLAMQQMQQQQ